MRRWTILLPLGLLAAPPLPAQDAGDRAELDSGTVVRLHWNDRTEKARLLAPLGPQSPVVHYCRYPSPVCGPATVNQPLARASRDLTRIDRRHGNRAGRGALIGLGIGTAGGLFLLWTQTQGVGSDLSGGEQAAALTILAGSWAGIGAIVGAMSDDWKPVAREIGGP